MSQTTNNRQKVFEDKSTRGPRRKLKLIIEDGNNSNRVNWYKPRKLIPLLDLEEDIKKSTCKRDLKERLQLTTWDKVIRLDLKTLGITRFSKERR